VPATPRDGADVEIVGLVKSTVRWLAALHKSGDYPYADADGFSYTEWDAAIQANFEKCFWVPETAAEDAKYDIIPAIVNRRGVYKDTVGSATPFADYQFRPNFCVAMTVAPELFDPQHARKALENAAASLLGGLGMRTLDPGDWNYRPTYINGADTQDFHTSRGFNYHQGPEWLWPTGYFFRARLAFAADAKEARTAIEHYMARYERELVATPWRGLPEICNDGGSFCADGCPTQAWSCSCILDALYDCHAKAM